MMRLGNSAVTRIETQVGLTVVSDGRYKYNVKEEVKGLDFIKKLRPVIYQYDTEKMDREWMKTEFDTMAKHNPQLLKDYQKASQIRYSGFIAQEVEQAAQSINYQFSGISKPENTDGHYGLDYASFVVPIVKAVQELANENTILKKQIHQLENKNKTIELRLQKLESN
jgi:dynactin complex subunit